MKAKTIKLRTAHLNLERNQICFNLSFEEFEELYRAWGRLTTNLSIEIPIPEPTITITPSMIDDAYSACLNDPELKKGTWMITHEIKKKLFPGWGA